MRLIDPVNIRHVAIFLIGVIIAGPTRTQQASPDHVDITWMSISNMFYQIGSLGILTDGYFTRIPQSNFYGGGGGLAYTHYSYRPDVEGITRAMNAIGGATRIQILLSGHSHFDHSFDSATWSRLTGARIIGPQTTCLQAEAEKLPASRCNSVFGREKISLPNGVTLRVVRLNHSGDSASNPEQHNPVELNVPPVPDPATGGLRGGVSEDFPNGGGVRGYLFIVDGPQGKFSWFFQNSASAADFSIPIVVDGVNYGSPSENLKAAMKDAALDSVDLWIGTGGAAIARLVVPTIQPKAYLPVHWDGLYSPFNAGMPRPFSDPALEEFLKGAGIQLLKPGQYMDKWRLDRNGVKPIENTAVKKAVGLSDVQAFPQ
jgi:L-ascorbate metabolism protein UlaG (beta-lactamase superfamily)